MNRAAAKNIARRAVALALLLCLFACTTIAQPDTPPVPAGTEKSVFFLNHNGWHSGLAFRRADIPPNLLPEAVDFPSAESLEFGWGDWDFYQASHAGPGLATRVAFFSRGSTLHVVGFNGAARDYFTEAEVYELTVSGEGFRNLIQFISDTFMRESGEKPRPGLYPDSQFYPARGRFHLFRNCNTWAAEALRAAELPVDPYRVVTAGNLSSQVKGLAKR
ncbi:MAG TPA: DUF2459 domain-containing protein [Candidatus Binatia bacterium]